MFDSNSLYMFSSDFWLIINILISIVIVYKLFDLCGVWRKFASAFDVFDWRLSASAIRWTIYLMFFVLSIGMCLFLGSAIEFVQAAWDGYWTWMDMNKPKNSHWISSSIMLYCRQ